VISSHPDRDLLYPDLSRPAIFTRIDWIIAFLIAAASTIFVYLHMHRPLIPYEDASMLLRYSQHLAQGYGIVWNIGDPPVEGATDFLYMVVIAGLSRLTGINVLVVTPWLLFVSHVCTTVILYMALRRLFHAPIIVAIGFAAYFSTGNGYHYVNSGFSAPFYSLAALCAWIAGL
jgi:hypothetical protein